MIAPKNFACETMLAHKTNKYRYKLTALSAGPDTIWNTLNVRHICSVRSMYALAGARTGLPKTAASL